jgi:hypothetical protein
VRPRTSYRSAATSHKRRAHAHMAQSRMRRACAMSTGRMERQATSGDSGGIARLRSSAAGATRRTRELTPAVANAAQAGLRASADALGVVLEASQPPARGPPRPWAP